MPVVGMVGAGQLARMTCQAAIGLGIGFRVLAGSTADSAAQVCAGTVIGDHSSLPDLLAFASGCDVVTFDHEHVPGPHVAELERAVAVRPGSQALRHTQDKLAMRERLRRLDVPCPRYAPVTTAADVSRFAERTGWPVVLKAVSGGYDGRGVWVCHGPGQAAEVLSHPVEVMAEEHIGFGRELAALVARSPHGQGAAYPVVETVQRDGVCHEVLAPAPGLAPGRAAEAQRLALDLAAALEVTGLLAVELFETPDGLLVNELAMRPHNSGHWTIEGAITSQFEQHLRAVLDLPLGDPRAAAPQAVTANVFGAEQGGGGDARAAGVPGPAVFQRYVHVMTADHGAKVHLYGKAARPGRKIGHVTVLSPGTNRASVAALRQRAGRAARYLATGEE
jgi:5-(carboxyamino)imidazole ribonucleotide synthase